MKRGRVLALSAALVLAAPPALADVLVKASLSYEQNEDRSAFIEQVRQARKGDTEAQWQVGSTYVTLGDPVRALPMLQSAATTGHAQAAALLGWLHEAGSGTARNADEARRWYLVAAEQGRADAMAALGRLTLQAALPDAHEAAWPWFEKAARLGHPSGQYHLGWLVAQRPGATRDDAAAHGWYLKAAQQGHLGAQVAVATHLMEGRGVAPDRNAAADWLLKASATQDPVANYLLGRLYQETGGSDLARKAYGLAAKAGHREAQFALAVLLAKSSMPEEQKEAADWFAKASEAGHKAAANRLGELHRDGAGEMRHLDKARAIFQAAAEQGNADAMYNLADMQNQGLGGQRDTRNALEWYTRAAQSGHVRAAEVVDRLLNSAVKLSDLGLKGFWQ